MMGCRFIMCTVHASTTELYHRNSDNIVRSNIPTAVSLKTQVSWYAALSRRWRLSHPSAHQNNMPTDTALQLQWFESSVTWLTTPHIYQPFNNYLHVTCLGHSYIHWQSQTAWWHTAGSQSSSTCRLCIGSHDTKRVQWLWVQQDKHICLYMTTKWLYTPECRTCVHRCRTCVHRCRETNCNSILLNKDKVWDLRFSQWHYWVFKYSELWWCVVGTVVPNVLKVCSAFIFMVKLYKNPTDDGTQSFAATGAACPTTQCHFPEDLQIWNLGI